MGKRGGGRKSEFQDEGNAEKQCNIALRRRYVGSGRTAREANALHSLKFVKARPGRRKTPLPDPEEKAKSENSHRSSKRNRKLNLKELQWFEFCSFLEVDGKLNHKKLNILLPPDFHHSPMVYENVEMFTLPCIMQGDAPIASRVLAMISIET